MKRNPLPREMYERVMSEEKCCRLCGRPEWYGEVHHIQALGMGIKDHSRENLCRLCFTCHTGIHAHGKQTYPRMIGRPPLVRGGEEE